MAVAVADRGLGQQAETAARMVVVVVVVGEAGHHLLRERLAEPAEMAL